LPSSISPAGIADRIATRDYYAKIMAVLENAGGYVRTQPGTQVVDTARRYYVYLFDWRQDIVDNARGLHALIEQVRRDYGRADLEVDVIAHSMAGLIARYYLRYGTEDVLGARNFAVTQAGASQIRRVMLLGTPSFGSVLAFTTLDAGYKLAFTTVPTEVVATFPSTYQLLPHALDDWLINERGEIVKEDIFDAEFWRRHGLSIFSPQVAARIRAAHGDEGFGVRSRFFAAQLERARRFTLALTAPVDDPGWRLVVFGGDCVPTAAKVVVTDTDVDAGRRFGKPAQFVAPGDGKVTKASLLARRSTDPTIPRQQQSSFPLSHALLLCERHIFLTRNVDFQNNLLNTLLTAGDF
jgi:hypothetical protein